MDAIELRGASLARGVLACVRELRWRDPCHVYRRHVCVCVPIRRARMAVGNHAKRAYGWVTGRFVIRFRYKGALCA